MTRKLDLPSLTTAGSLREQIRDSLRSKIIAGVLRPGELYSAPRLAAEFGVSATPVREAMLDLVAEGLVEVARNKGFRVTSMSEDELDALAEVRGLIEIPVMTAISRACTGELARAVEELRPLARQMVDVAAAGDLAAYVRLDTDFHLRFLSVHNNPTVLEVVADLRARSRLYGLQELADNGSLAVNAREHEQLIDAALARDPARMRDLMATHIHHLRALWA